MGINNRRLSSDLGYSLLYMSDTEQSIIGSQPRQSKGTIVPQDSREYPGSLILLTGFKLLAALPDSALGFDKLGTELRRLIQKLGVCEARGRQVQPLWAKEYCQLVTAVVFR